MRRSRGGEGAPLLGRHVFIHADGEILHDPEVRTCGQSRGNAQGDPGPCPQYRRAPRRSADPRIAGTAHNVAGSIDTLIEEPTLEVVVTGIAQSVRVAQLYQDLPALAGAHIEIGLVPAEPEPAQVRDRGGCVDQIEIEARVLAIDLRDRCYVAGNDPALAIETRIEAVRERRAAKLPGPECACDEQCPMRRTIPEKERASQAQERQH